MVPDVLRSPVSPAAEHDVVESIGLRHAGRVEGGQSNRHRPPGLGVVFVMAATESNPRGV